MKTLNTLSNPNEMPPINHVEVSINGVTQQTVSYLDRPVPASEEQRMRLGDDADAQLETERARQIGKHNNIMALPSHEEGLDTDRVRMFMADQGAQPTDFRVLNQHDFEEALRIDHGYHSNIAAAAYEDSSGVHLFSGDVSAITRDAVQEHYNTVALTEGKLVHELGHQWTTVKFNRVNGRTELTRGFMSGGRGEALEEGWSCLLYARYIERVTGGSGLYSGQLYGESERLRKHVFRIMPDDEAGNNIPYDHHNASYAGVILEQLIEHDSELYQVMCAARDDPDRIHEMQERMDAIQPGIYEKLMSIDMDSSAKAQNQLKRLAYELHISLLEGAHNKLRARLGSIAVRLASGSRYYFE